MRKTQILKELENYLTPVQVVELDLIMGSLPGNIGMCLTVNDIVRNYNSTEQNERRVSYLLAHLCKCHFSKIEYGKV